MIDEQTYAELEQIAARYPEKRSGLLPMLHLVQSAEGYISQAGIEACAQILEISAADVTGVSTFYTMYKRQPVGTYHVGVCTNTLCAIMGGDEIYGRVSEHLGIGDNECTDDGEVSLERVECNAACDYAPVVMVNWEFMDNQTPESTVQLVDDLRAGVEVHSTRGPRICTWREAERVLAGFPDGLADEGPAAGPASLVGLELAREKGWTAPGPAALPAGSEAEPVDSEPVATASTTSETTAEKPADEKPARKTPPAKAGDAKPTKRRRTRKPRSAPDASRSESEAEVAASDAEAHHVDNPDTPGGER